MSTTAPKNPIVDAFYRDVSVSGMSVEECARSWIGGESWETFEDMYSNEVVRGAVEVIRRLGA